MFKELNYCLLCRLKFILPADACRIDPRMFVESTRGCCRIRNNPQFARECTEGIKGNVFYLDGSDYIEEFYTLVLCKSFIISNSTFGWWASWLSTSQNKIVIAPNPWFACPYNNSVMRRDLLPSEYLIIEK